MAECYRCGVSDERERLFDAISNKGVVKVCKNCSNEDESPLIQPVDLNKPEKVKTVYERLSSMANLDPNKHRQMIQDRAKEDSMRRYKQDRQARQDVTLKGVIDSNFEKRKPQPRTDLVNNFHWVLMRMRRSKKLTQKQLAEAIGEPESAIKSAEEGTILINSDNLVRKLENYLGVKLRKGEGASLPEGSAGRFVKGGIAEDPERKAIRERFEKEGNFDSKTTETLTIEDLKEINEKKEKEGGFFSFLKRKKKKEEPVEDAEENVNISDEEANKILFGK